ncbi:uncharacterized protein F5147DRAFT_768035 [Suillus discolor]|uniref:Importin subunit beta-1/Transportin-1-like TPR repeats domain-containing protein n=1 Tax=Suillus discolor TaxID=1912936 RepID=A0A9P7FII7_9AGAM|nr:uncharacterized protein F5147DRAFT_768035 [Suillus discolor]KAG2117893.1 hypothetical protein F5147DRAFT_768035 [Suillus discolor]
MLSHSILPPAFMGEHTHQSSTNSARHQTFSPALASSPALTSSSHLPLHSHPTSRSPALTLSTCARIFTPPLRMVTISIIEDISRAPGDQRAQYTGTFMNLLLKNLQSVTVTWHESPASREPSAIRTAIDDTGASPAL